MKAHGRWALLVAFPVGFFLLVVVIVEVVAASYSRSLTSDQRLNTFAYGAELRGRVERELNGVLHLTSGLGSYFSVRRDSLVADEINRIFQLVYETSHHVRSFGLAVGYQIVHVYPLQGNEAALGVDYRDLPQQWPKVQQAIAKRQSLLTDQLEIIQGGRTFIYREPIFVGDEYWGLLSTLIDSDSILQAMFGDIVLSGYQFAVRSPSGIPLWGEANLFDAADSLQLVTEQGWEIAVLPDTSGTESLPLTLIRVLGWLLAVVTALGVYTALLHRQSLTRLALHDNLTGLPNRVLLEDRVEQALRRVRSRRNAKAVDSCPIVLFIDLDDFKRINDTHGHRVGDFVLKEIARRLQASARTGDTVARWAGDEFIMLVEQLPEKSIETLLQRVRDAIEEPISHEGLVLHLTASMGYAIAEPGKDDIDELIWTADHNMYEQKAKSKNE